MDLNALAIVIAGGVPLLALAASYGSLNTRIETLKEKSDHYETQFGQYVTREEFRAMERRMDGMDDKLDRILELVMNGSRKQ